MDQRKKRKSYALEPETAYCQHSFISSQTSSAPTVLVNKSANPSEHKQLPVVSPHANILDSFINHVALHYFLN